VIRALWKCPNKKINSQKYNTINNYAEMFFCNFRVLIELAFSILESILAGKESWNGKKDKRKHDKIHT